jgi:hypothetical protein
MSPESRNGLHRLAQIGTFAIFQRDEYSLCTSKFESDMPSHGVGLSDVSRRDALLAFRQQDPILFHRSLAENIA